MAMISTRNRRTLQRFFEGAQRVDVEVVGRLVEQHDVSARFQHLGEVHAVTLTAGQLTDLFLLIAAFEVELGNA